MHYYVGWDVGAWHCDTNPASRDALVVLADGPDGLLPVGRPFWGNLREDLSHHRGPALAAALLARCAIPLTAAPLTIAIDTPLGWPVAAIDLLAAGEAIAVPAASQDDPYLFRATERLLFAHGHRPLSAVRDMIGSQSLKGIHAVRCFGAQQERLGVWTLRTEHLQVELIETYPAPYAKLPTARQDGQLKVLLDGTIPPRDSLACRQDTRDAVFCAWLAWSFVHAQERLLAPGAGTPAGEGWIWLPREVYDRSAVLREQGGA